LTPRAGCHTLAGRSTSKHLSDDAMAARGKGAFPFVIVVIGGLIGIFEFRERPAAHAVRAVDIVQLVASGMCLGVALAWLIAGLRGKPIE